MNSQVTVHVPPESEGCCSIHKMPLTSFQGRMAASGQNEDHSIHGCSVISMLIIGAHQVGMCTTGIVGEIIDRVCPTIISPIRQRLYAGLGYTFISSELAQEAVTQKFLLSVSGSPCKKNHFASLGYTFRSTCSRSINNFCFIECEIFSLGAFYFLPFLFFLH